MRLVRLKKPIDLGFVEITHTYKEREMNKYRNKKMVLNGRVYDSKKEMLRAIQLRQMEKMGMISDLQEQVRFVLQEPFVNNYGKKIREIAYIADFTYEKDGKQIVEDVKSQVTRNIDVFRIKHKMFEKRYPEKFFTFF